MLGKPKEDVFYTMFREFGDKIVETAEEYVALWRLPETAARIPQMRFTSVSVTRRSSTL